MQLLGFLAIALTAVFAIYLSASPPRGEYIADDALLADLVNVSPAAGDVVPGSVASTPNVPQEPKELEKGKAYAVTQIFDSEEACKEATNLACHLVKCEGDALPPVVDEAAKPIVKPIVGVENACAENEKTGWRSVVPAPDKTAIPDVIAPPAELTTE